MSGPLFVMDNPGQRDGVIGRAIFKAFILAFIVIVGILAYNHWYNSNVSTYSASHTLEAAKSTRLIAVREIATGSECPPEMDCFITTTLQVVNGTLYAAFDPSIVVGTSVARCLALGDFGSSDIGIWQQCTAMYTFNGEGNITAGTVHATGRVLWPEDMTSYLQSFYMITGGTGDYAAISGGALSYTIIADVDHVDLSFAFVSVD
jgi:hypothetical protein